MSKKPSVLLDLIEALKSKKTRRQYFLGRFYKDENRCCLCNNELQFSYSKEASSDSLIEVAECKSCQIKVRQRQHKVA